MFDVAPEHRIATQETAADRLFGLLEKSAPGGDGQLLLARAFAGQGSGPRTSSPQSRPCWTGSRVIEGLAIDTEMRWGLLAALVTGGAAGEPEITAELGRDDTASGRVHAALVRASVPTPEAKAEAWRQVVDQAQPPQHRPGRRDRWLRPGERPGAARAVRRTVLRGAGAGLAEPHQRDGQSDRRRPLSVRAGLPGPDGAHPTVARRHRRRACPEAAGRREPGRGHPCPARPGL